MAVTHNQVVNLTLHTARLFVMAVPFYYKKSRSMQRRFPRRYILGAFNLVKLLIVLIVSLLLYGCANAPTVSSMRDDEIRSKLIGVWANKASESDDVWGYDNYFDDGTVHALFFLEEDIGLDNREWYYIRSDWEVVDGSSCFVVTGGTPNNPLELGYRFCSKVLFISNKKVTFLEDDGEIFTIYKVSSHKLKKM